MRLFNSIFLCLLLSNLAAQQRPQYAQYFQNNFIINPALAGIESYADAKLSFRKQWVGLTASPKTLYLTGHLPIKNEDFNPNIASPRYVPSNRRLFSLPDAHFGTGFTVVHDKAGPLLAQGLSVAGAYHYPISDFWQISAGISAGILQYSYQFDNIKVPTSNDPLLLSSNVTLWKPDFGVGVWLYSPDFFMGFSAQQFVARKWGTKQANNSTELVPHYFFTAGYKLYFNDEWTFVPSALVKKATNTPLSVDLNLKIDYLNQLWFGLSYRHKDALLSVVGFRLAEAFSLGYAYEYPISGLRSSTSGSHEMVLGLTVGGRIKAVSPRGFW